MKQTHVRHYVTKLLVEIMFYGGIVVCVALPFIMPRLLAFVGGSQEMRLHYTIVLLSSGMCAVYILFQLKRMFRTLVGGNPFIVQNVSCLRQCAVASALIAFIYFVRLLMWFTIPAAIIMIVFAMLSLFSLTLKDLFKQAVTYKEETDWTV